MGLFSCSRLSACALGLREHGGARDEPSRLPDSGKLSCVSDRVRAAMITLHATAVAAPSSASFMAGSTALHVYRNIG